MPVLRGPRGLARRPTLRPPADGDWQVRVVPNLYPAFERQEVVVHTPEHCARSPSFLARRCRSLRRLGDRAPEGFATSTRSCNEGPRRSEPSAHALPACLAARAAARGCPRWSRWTGAGRETCARAGEGQGHLPCDLVRPLRDENCSSRARGPAFASDCWQALSTWLPSHGARALEPGAPANLWLARRALVAHSSCLGSPFPPASSSAPAST